jgi:hypothetical protein
MLKLKTHSSMIYFVSDMSKSTNTVVYKVIGPKVLSNILTWPPSFQTSELSIWCNLISTCAGECDWLFHWQYKLCATFSANININNRLPIKVYYRICTSVMVEAQVVQLVPHHPFLPLLHLSRLFLVPRNLPFLPFLLEQLLVEAKRKILILKQHSQILQTCLFTVVLIHIK